MIKFTATHGNKRLMQYPELREAVISHCEENPFHANSKPVKKNEGVQSTLNPHLADEEMETECEE